MIAVFLYLQIVKIDVHKFLLKDTLRASTSPVRRRSYGSQARNVQDITQTVMESMGDTEVGWIFVIA